VKAPCLSEAGGFFSTAGHMAVCVPLVLTLGNNSPPSGSECQKCREAIAPGLGIRECQYMWVGIRWPQQLLPLFFPPRGSCGLCSALTGPGDMSQKSGVQENVPVCPEAHPCLSQGIWRVGEWLTVWGTGAWAKVWGWKQLQTGTVAVPTST
jgi:hypothetical protein